MFSQDSSGRLSLQHYFYVCVFFLVNFNLLYVNLLYCFLHNLLNQCIYCLKKIYIFTYLNTNKVTMNSTLELPF